MFAAAMKTFPFPMNGRLINTTSSAVTTEDGIHEMAVVTTMVEVEVCQREEEEKRRRIILWTTTTTEGSQWGQIDTLLLLYTKRYFCLQKRTIM